jgi:hypothetical protein
MSQQPSRASTLKPQLTNGMGVLPSRESLWKCACKYLIVLAGTGMTQDGAVKPQTVEEGEVDTGYDQFKQQPRNHSGSQ